MAVLSYAYDKLKGAICTIRPPLLIQLALAPLLKTEAVAATLAMLG